MHHLPEITGKGKRFDLNSQEIELLGHLLQFGPSVFQAVRIYRKHKKIISRDIRQSAINLTKILFYEPFLVWDIVKHYKQKVDKRNNIVKSNDRNFYHST